MPLSRRISLVLVLSLFLLALLPTSSIAISSSSLPLPTTPASTARPNIIWLQSDSMDGRLHDPTDEVMFNKLLLRGFRSWTDSGVTFVRHYSNSPQCVPSRTSMMTGRYVHSIATPNNGQGIAFSTLTGKLDVNCIAEWSEDWCSRTAAIQRQRGVNKTIIDVMRDMDYDLALFGRFDTGAGILQDYPHTNGDGWHDGPSLAILARGAALWGSINANPLSSTTENDHSPYQNDVRVQELALQWLQNRAPSEKPFFLWLGMLCPHPPYASNSSWISHVNTTAPDVPPQIPRNQTHFYDAYMSMSKGAWTANYTDDQIKLMRQAYWGAASEASVLMEQLIELASRTGALNNTVVIITSDHGEMSMEHRQDLKNSMREPSVRVPLNIIPLGVSGMSGVGGRIIKNVTSHLDILPTLVELGGGILPPGAVGQSLVPFLKTAVPGDAPVRKPYVAVEYHSNFAPVGSYALIQPPWKLIVYGHYFPYLNATVLPPQLFNTQDDPREMVDLAASRPDVVAALTATLEAELGAQIQDIEADMMEDNLANYKLQWFETCTGEELVKALMNAYSGVSQDDVIARVTEWSGVSPLNATGPGGFCGGRKHPEKVPETFLG